MSALGLGGATLLSSFSKSARLTWVRQGWVNCGFSAGLVRLGGGVSHSPSMVMTVAVGGTTDSDGLLEGFACGALGVCDAVAALAGGFASPAWRPGVWLGDDWP